MLRRLIYCGEWIESHGLHVVMLHAPDFLGFPDGIAMARVLHAPMVKNGLAIQKAGNEIMQLLGGREIHPVSVKAGGFHRVPTRAELNALAEKLKHARDLAVGLARWVALFPFPDFEQDYEFVALRHPDEYPFNEGRLVSSRGLDIDIADYDREFEERDVAHSTALHSVLKRRGAYLVGPLARYALNFDLLPASVRTLARDTGMGPVCKNPFRSIVVRAIEIVYAFEEALRIIADYERPAELSVKLEPRAGVGFGCTEAPRGICWHRYELEADGTIKTARILFRRRRRTSPASRLISKMWRHRSWISRTTSSGTVASKASAITILAFPARRILRSCRSIAHDIRRSGRGAAENFGGGYRQPGSRR